MQLCYFSIAHRLCASLWALSVLSLVPSVILYNCHLLFSLLWITEEEKNRITSQNCPCQTQSTLGPSQTGFRSFHVCALCSTGSPWKHGATKYYCYLLAGPGSPHSFPKESLLGIRGLVQLYLSFVSLP